ncbi:hypothetical protein OG612_45195 (plasmid) [Streptomyces sp. NBC_01527]|uniref:hypothetical protein n=1 Tax=Streptomyces sp. NBC_01527 TaxID=2903894 RepID=UPI002F90F545
MTSTPRQTAHQIASSMIEGASMATALIGGAAGAFFGYQLVPASWSGETRILAAGAVAVVGAVIVDGLAELVLAPLRRLLISSRYRTPDKESPALPGSLADTITAVAAAAASDAADQAAMAARIKLDRSADGSFLTAAEQWTGYENGEASLFLAPGVQLHFASFDDGYGRERKFTLLTSEQDAPVAITTLAQLHQHLTAREAGLPVAQPGDDNKALSNA